MDIADGNIVRTTDGKVLMSLSELAMHAQYNPNDSLHITAESTYTIRNNAYSFGCTFAEVEVDIPMCKVTLKDMETGEQQLLTVEEVVAKLRP